MSGNDGTPLVPHVAAEFYAWLWWESEKREGAFELGGDVGRVVLWVDDRIAFRRPGESRVSAVLTGENPATSLEARAALAGGKVLQELRIGMRRDDREFLLTLRGPGMDLTGIRLPQVIADGKDEVLYDRMFLYDEVCFVLAALMREFAAARTHEDWRAQTLPALVAWVGGGSTS
jgi:hypothetical protein